MGKLQLMGSVTLALLVCVLGIIQFSCGGGSQGSIQPVGTSNDAGSFGFQVMPESLVGDASSEFTHNVIRTGSAVTIEVGAQGASGLKALYFELDYDAAVYHPVGVEYSDLLGDTTELLTIDVTNRPGKVFCGQVLKQFIDLDGFTGSGTLATVRFEKGAVPHSASIPPTSSSSKVIPHFIAPGVVSWLYSNTGDYDQNSEVNVADLSQIAKNYGVQGPFDPESALWMVDGDFNGEINLADITPIAINYASTVTDYQIMSTPFLPGGEDPLMLGIIEFESGITEGGRRISFVVEIVGEDGGIPEVRVASYFPVYDPEGDFYWDYDTDVRVVPFDASEDGVPSDPFVDKPGSNDPILALQNLPATGTGHFTDPYILYQTDDLAGNPLSFTLTDPSAGNVTTSTDTGFYMNTANFGVFSSTTPGLFEFIDPPTHKGPFHIYSVYKGDLGYPPAIYFVMLPTQVAGPVLTLENPPNEGSGTSADPYIADATTEYIFSLDSEGNDVSTDSGTRYTTIPPEVGYISSRDAKLDIADGFNGLVRVTAAYFGTANTAASTVFMQVGTVLTNNPPTISSTNIVGGALSVKVVDLDVGDILTVSVTEFTGLVVDNTAKVAAGDPPTATFYWSPENMLVGGSGKTTITVNDGNGGTDTKDVTITIPPLKADTLYAIPMQPSVQIGESVTVLVTTGGLPSTFQYLSNLGLTLDDDCSYVPNSFNVGAIGGAIDDADGIWSRIIDDGGFILGPDQLIFPGADPDGTLGDRYRFDLNVVPLGGVDIDNGEGDLLNMKFTFSEPGIKTLGFQEFNGVDRTYYSNQSSGFDTYFWGDITNDHAGIPNSFTVTDGSGLPILTLTNPPGQGDGSAEAPFVVDDATGYIFSLTDPTAGDVSNDPLTSYSLSDPAAGSIAAGNATLNITDAYTGTFNVSANYFGLASNKVYMSVVLEWTYLPDTLYAIPLSTTAQVFEPVTIGVYSGETSNPFLFLDMVSVTVESGASYVDNSFNVGIVGGDTGDADGIWDSITSDWGFLLLPDSLIISTDIGAGRERWEFTIASLGGSEVTDVSGGLFNFQFTFDSPGVYTLGFQEFDSVDRTYYTDQLGTTNYFWGDISNDHVGIPNSITISE